ncbi:MAG: ATP-binding protein [Pseudomonadota bacterium]|nr:ATP-binding protein [Pseudomonadota bacterium]
MTDQTTVDAALAEASLELVHTLSYRQGNLSEYLDQVASLVARLLEVDWAAVTFEVEDGRERVLASTLASVDKERLYEYHGSVSDTVLRSGEPLVIPNAELNREYGNVPSGFCAYLGVPLFNLQGRCVGTICTFHKTERDFSDEHVRVATIFAERASVAIDNYELYRNQVAFNERLEREVDNRTRELERTQARLIERGRLAAIGEFASAIVHEIRSPLSTVGMTLQHLERLGLDAGATRRIELATKETRRLEVLMEEILAYAKPHTSTAFQAVPVKPLLDEVLEMFEGQSDDPEARIVLDTPAEVVAVMADPDKLKQVLINVIGNALDASPNNQKVRIACQRDDSGAVLIRVNNGGRPIPADLIPRLTEPFFSTKPNGTGLGLAIVRRIVEAHGGDLEITSTGDGGTTVSVSLPTCPQ